MQSFFFRGIKINNVNFEEVLKIIRQNIHRKVYICVTDVGNVMKAQKDKGLKESINQSLLSIPDGKPLEWYGKLIGYSKIVRIPGFELMKHLFENEYEYKHFLLGDTEETQHQVIKKAKNINSRLKIDCYSPPFKNEFNDEDNKIIINKIQKSNPDIIWVSFGGTKQEKWIKNNIGAINRGIMIGVGAAFKFYIGELIIPPKQIQRIGLQWTSRLMDNPKFFIINGPLICRIMFLFYLPIEIKKNRKHLKSFT